MLKRGLAVLCGICLLFSAAGCGKKPPEQVVFQATVLENHDTSLLVRPKDGYDELKSADQIEVSLGKAKLTDEEGNPLEAKALEMGSVVEITYDGLLALSYPAQLADCFAVKRLALPQPGASCGPAGCPNPLKEYDTPDFTDLAGFAAAQLPQLDGMTLEKCWLIGGRLAQLDYLLELDTEMTFRVAVDTGEDITGVYEDNWEEDAVNEDEGVQVRFRASAGGPALATWSKDGYAFSLYFPHPQMGMAGGVTHSFVAGVTMEPAQAPSHTTGK